MPWTYSRKNAILCTYKYPSLFTGGLMNELIFPRHSKYAPWVQEYRVAQIGFDRFC